MFLLHLLSGPQPAKMVSVVDLLPVVELHPSKKRLDFCHRKLSIHISISPHMLHSVQLPQSSELLGSNMRYLIISEFCLSNLLRRIHRLLLEDSVSVDHVLLFNVERSVWVSVSHWSHQKAPDSPLPWFDQGNHPILALENHHFSYVFSYEKIMVNMEHPW